MHGFGLKKHPKRIYSCCEAQLYFYFTHEHLSLVRSRAVDPALLKYSSLADECRQDQSKSGYRNRESQKTLLSKLSRDQQKLLRAVSPRSVESSGSGAVNISESRC